MMELFTTGKMTLKLFKLIEPLIEAMSLTKIKSFKNELESKGVQIPHDVNKAFDQLYD